MIKSAIQRFDERHDPYWASKATETAYYKYVKRIKQRIEEMIKAPHPYFITFTIRDEDLGKSIVTYIDKIKKALGGAESWIVNEDYGATNGRLHFHAFASYDYQLDYTTITKIWQYGSVDFEHAYNQDAKSVRLYLLKVTNHTIKDSAKKIWRSRRKRSE